MRAHAQPTVGLSEADITDASSDDPGSMPPPASGAQAYDRTIDVNGPEASAHLGVIRHELSAWLEDHPRLDDLCLTVTELLTNAIVHGTSRGGIVRVRVIRTTDAWLTVDVTDSGQTDDATCSGAGLGLGLRIVRTLAQRCRTCAMPGGGRRVHLLLSSQSPAADESE